MAKYKIDTRIKQLIYHAAVSNHRSLFIIIGENAKMQVPLMHHIALKAKDASPADASDILWLRKKDQSNGSRKQLKQLQKKINSGQLDTTDTFDLFLASNDIQYCHYNDSQRILGQTFGMCILEDFAALTPNILARTIETVRGGGLVVFLLPFVKNLNQILDMTMDVHGHYRTESHPNVKGRFNKRLFLSLADCPNCIITDDQLKILPIKSVAVLPAASSDQMCDGNSEELSELYNMLENDEALRQFKPLIKCCLTTDQAKAVVKFIEALSDRASPSTIVSTAARGRGKSAALGLALAGAVALGFSRMFVTAPSPENVSTVFGFLCQGLNALNYETRRHYDVTYSDFPEFNHAVVGISIFKNHRQIVKYIEPSCHQQLGQPDVLCIDEAAAIPLPVVKKLIEPYFVFMSSTVNGYEGTGRSLSLKLIDDLRHQSIARPSSEKHQDARKKTMANATGIRMLHEVSLNRPIRYADGDPVEAWLYNVLCLDVDSRPRFLSSCPSAADCRLFYVDRDTLFSYCEKAEEFLKRLVAIYVSSHYKNTPNDLQLLADAPAHHLFCLLGPDEKDNELPEILCVVQVAFEGRLSEDSIQKNLQRGERASGDMIPWTVEQQFEGHNFARKSGLRIVRIATHPDYQGMGYGSRTLQLLQSYFEGRIPRLPAPDDGIMQSESEVAFSLDEQLIPQRHQPPLLVHLGHRTPEPLDYIGVSFGITPELLKFWRRFGMLAMYIRQTPNEVTGEHSCIMVKNLNSSDIPETDEDSDWIKELWTDFRKRFLRLLSHDFRSWRVSTALDLLHHQTIKVSLEPLSTSALRLFVTKSDLQRLEKYSNNLVDYRLIKDLMQPLAILYFCRHLDLHLNAIKSAILLGIGLQGKSIDDLVAEFNSKDRNFSAAQALALLNRTVKDLSQSLCVHSQEVTKTERQDFKPHNQNQKAERFSGESCASEKTPTDRKRKFSTAAGNGNNENKQKTKRTD